MNADPRFIRLLYDFQHVNQQLAKARRKPVSLLLRLIKFRLINLLLIASPVLPQKITQRLKENSAKSDPNRSIIQMPINPEILSNSKLEDDHEDDDGRLLPEFRYSDQTIESFDGEVCPEPGKKTIIVVSHEASRTGAPIVALNLVQSLSKRYNVVSLLMGGGVLMENFKQSSTKVWLIHQSAMPEPLAKGVIEAIRKECEVQFAVVNSICSHYVLEPLRKHNIPSLLLIHEFASYTRPESVFQNALENADHVVFSTNITLDDAVETHKPPNAGNFHVIPQGKCVVPGDLARNMDSEEENIRSILKPDGIDTSNFVVMGAGTVEYRKGVDVFIDVARKAASKMHGLNPLFIWIGHGYNSDHDQYSIYLCDQIKRANLQDIVHFLPPTPAIETAYALSDVFILSSRLDPLPNVTIDAISAGLPVLCFDNTSGIAEILKDAGLERECVSPYMDSADMAEKIVNLSLNRGQLADLKTRSLGCAKSHLEFDGYAGKIEKILTGHVS